MSFSKTYITGTIIGIFYIEERRISFAGIEIKNGSISLLHYKEKRIEAGILQRNECKNTLKFLHVLEGMLVEAISKGVHISELICNQYTLSSPYILSDVGYSRDIPHVPIEQDELTQILQYTQSICQNKLENQVYSYDQRKESSQLFFSRIESVKIDGETQNHLLGKTGKNIKTLFFQTAINRKESQIFYEIQKFLRKPILSIIPSEYSTLRLFEQDNICIIRIYESHCSVSLRVEGKIAGIKKVDIGSMDLYKKIRASHDIGSITQILEGLEQEKYPEEVTFFLSVLSESLSIALAEMLESSLCPQNMHIDSRLIPVEMLHLLAHKLQKEHNELFSPNPILFTEPHYKSLLKNIPEIKIEDISRIPLEMYGLMEEARQHVMHSNDPSSLLLSRLIGSQKQEDIL